MANARRTGGKQVIPLSLHPGQMEIAMDPARFKVLVAGRRWGKSRLLLSYGVALAAGFKGEYDPASPPVCLIAMPTLKQARAIHWLPLLKLLENDPRVRKIYKSDFRISFLGRKPDILVRGANDKGGDSLRGLKLYLAGLDEFQDFLPDVWDEVIRPALGDTKNSRALIIATPKGRASHLYRFVQQAEVNRDLGWKYYHRITADNPWVEYANPGEIEQARRALPPKSYRQEYEASFEDFDGQIYSCFDRKKNTIPRAVIANLYPFDSVIMGVDWGDMNPALVVLGRKGAHYYVLDEWANPEPKNAVEQHTFTQVITEKCEIHRVDALYCDPSQPARIVSLRRTGCARKIVAGWNKVLEGNNVVNTMYWQQRLMVADDLTSLCEEVESYHRYTDKLGNMMDEPAPAQKDHRLDALRYAIASLEQRLLDSIISPASVVEDRIIVPDHRLYRDGQLPWA